jgi:protein-S-isoprenylcysteine O-methyltransferase Ste14
MNTIQWVLFAIGTLAILYFSWWLSLKHGRWHGIPRFFAFVSILFLVLRNIPAWFHDPFCIRQALSWFALTLSLALALHGFYLLKALGKPEGKFENTSRLVVTGLYRYIRHPLYASLFWLGLGAFLKGPDLVTLGPFLVMVTAVVLTARAEEGEMIAKFGDEYRGYMKKTKRFVPFVF